METESNVERVSTFHDSENCPTCIAEREELDDYLDEMEADDSLDGACLCHDSFACPDEYNGAFDYITEDY